MALSPGETQTGFCSGAMEMVATAPAMGRDEKGNHGRELPIDAFKLLPKSGFRARNLGEYVPPGSAHASLLTQTDEVLNAQGGTEQYLHF